MAPELNSRANHRAALSHRWRKLGPTLAPLLLLAGMTMICALPLYHDAFWRGAPFATLWPNQVLFGGGLLAAAGLLGLTRLTPHVTGRHVALWLLLLLLLPLPSWALDAPVADVAWAVAVLYCASLGLMVAYRQENNRRRQIGNILAALSLAIPLAGFLLWTLTAAFSRPVPLLGDCHIFSDARRDGCVRTVRSTTPVYLFVNAEGETKLVYGNGRRLWIETPDPWGRWFDRTTFLLQRGGNVLTLVPTPRRDYLYVQQNTRMITYGNMTQNPANRYLIDLTAGKAVVRGVLVDEKTVATRDVSDLGGRGYESENPFPHAPAYFAVQAPNDGRIVRAEYGCPHDRRCGFSLWRLAYQIRPDRIHSRWPTFWSPPWDIERDLIWSRRLGESLECVAFTPTGTRLMVVGKDTFTVVDAGSGIVVPGPSSLPTLSVESEYDLCPLRFLTEETILLVTRTELVTWSLSTGRFTHRRSLPQAWSADAARNREIEIGPNREYLTIGHGAETKFRPEETRAIYRLRP